MGIFDWLFGKRETSSHTKKDSEEIEKERQERIKKNKELIADFTRQTLKSKNDPSKLKVIEEVLKDFINKIKGVDMSEVDRNHIIPEFEKLLEKVTKYKNTAKNIDPDDYSKFR